MATIPDGTDASSIKPVSSLRSKFENLGKETEQKPPSPIDRRQPSVVIETVTATTARPSTSSGEVGKPAPIALGSDAAALSASRKRRPSPPRPRPQSMLSVTPSQQSPPMLNPRAPRSPRSPRSNLSVDLRPATRTPSLTPTSRQSSPTRGHAKTLSRATTPALEARVAVFQSTEPPPKIDFASKPRLTNGDHEPPDTAKATIVNRPSKPSVPKKPAVLAQKPTGLSVPEPAATLTEPMPSPFNTPPGSGPQSPDPREEAHHSHHGSDASFVERIRSDSGSSAMSHVRADSNNSHIERFRGDSETGFAGRARAESTASWVEPLPSPDNNFQPPPTHHQVAAKREQQSYFLPRTSTMPARYKPAHYREQGGTGESPEDKPRLPARPELQVRSGRTSPTKPRSGRTSPSKLSQQLSFRRSTEGLRRAATIDEPSYTASRIPATKATSTRSALTQGFDRSTMASTAHAVAAPAVVAPALTAPAVPVPRRSLDKRRDIPATPVVHTDGQSRDDEPDIQPIDLNGSQSSNLSEYPDSTRSNRRPPKYRQRPYQIPTDYDTRLFVVSGEIICTSGYITKAWNVRTGEQLLNMVHNENVKVSAVVFKPSPNPEDDGKRLWLGTSIGEIHEVDIPSQSLVKTKVGAHVRREVIKLFRHGTELWSLDDGGELNVWKPDHKGYPSLDSRFDTYRTPRGHSFSIVCGDHLWIACGKDIRVFKPGVRTDEEFQVLRGPLLQPGTGDVTCGATLSSDSDKVFFGHADGKVSIYSRRDYSCQGVVSVSLYKISSMAGVGDYLWAGYNTGMAYVYDTSTNPWRVRKDWQAHDKQICSIVADASALWKMDRLHVVSLGTDNMLRFWDGFLEDDWLESHMQEHDSDYCSFRELSAAVLTWNAGATKPSHLQHSSEDSGFFSKYLTSRGSPEFFVFGFQELVDLEDKKMTAKSFFKSKKKDPAEPEQMSHQYRAWRDHLTRCIEESMPPGDSYTLLHTASMVGLFTCIFVKASERDRIKHVHAAEVKRGMGGLHGNKGALIMRLVLDDSSICFTNCHLAAGQTQTIHRNNDVAAILEANALPAFPLHNTGVAQHGDVFSSGGDGSMILDHEICILNGDLNYRIDTMGRDTVVKHIMQRNLPRLLERDQLLLSRKKNPGFRLRSFSESPIMFAPTYKYNVRSDDYDTSEKRRAPAWCDRILYRGLGKVKMEEYRRWEVRVSDHRPVSGRLRLRVKSVDGERREKVWQACLKEFDQVRARIATAVQHEYLVNTLGLSPKDATAALKQ